MFTKLSKPISQWLREREIISAVYIYDTLIIGQSYKECLSNVSRAKGLLESLEFILNLDKCQLEPATEIKFLGVIIDSWQLSFNLPKEKIEKIKKLVSQFKRTRSCRIRDLAKFVRTLSSACFRNSHRLVWQLTLITDSLSAKHLGG